MPRDFWSPKSIRGFSGGWLLLAPLAVLGRASGCSHEARIEFTNTEKPPKVQLIKPPVRKIVRVVGQPSFIESFERTSIYPKPSAYIQKWIVDIGDKVKKGDVLAHLFALELVEESGYTEESGRSARPRTDRAGE